MKDKIEILGLDIFETHKVEMDIVERVRQHLNQGIGWHYHLDLAWMVKQIKDLPKGALILDAGAGMGIAQSVLSEMGYNVISADFTNREISKFHGGKREQLIRYLNDQSQVFDNRYTQHLKKNYRIPVISTQGLKSWFSGLFRSNEDPLDIIDRNRYRPKDEGGAAPRKKVAGNRGSIFLYKCDLKDMSILPDDFVDAVVSISALEHNDHQDFDRCIEEILRVTKPGGKLAITISASQTDDWFHEPSKGWCYSEASVKKLFRLPEDVQSNFSRKDELFEMLKKENNELHKRLAPFYFKSGDNGMPWGKWDPHYQPLGVVKIKR